MEQEASSTESGGNQMRRIALKPYTGAGSEGKTVAQFERKEAESGRVEKMSIFQLKALKKHLEDSIEKEKAFKIDQEDLLKISKEINDTVGISVTTTKIMAHDENITKLTDRLKEVTDELQKRERSQV